MTSTALSALHDGLREIEALQRANPSPAAGGGLTRPDVTRAIGRAEVVLLCSHLEQFVYALVEAATDALATAATPSENLSRELRLLHSKAPIEDASMTAWERREDKLAQIAQDVAPLWSPGTTAVVLEPKRLLASMKTPDPTALVRAFRPWGVENVFDAITRTAHHRARLWLKIRELAEKRNNIAHGDYTEEATYLDVAGYRRAVRDFGERVDRLMARRVSAIVGSTVLPW